MLSLAIGVLLLAYGLVDAGLNAPDERAWRLCVGWVPGLALLGLHRVSRSRHVPPSLAPSLTVLGILIVTFGQVVTIVLSRQVSDLVVLLVLWCVSGAAALGTVHCAALAVVLLPTWAFCARLVVPGDGLLLAGEWTGTVLATLVAAAAVHVSRAVSFREQARMQDELAQLARTDPLTGVLSRYGAAAVFARTLADAARQRTSLFAVFIDVDGLKRANDAFGHDAGDVLITAAGRAIAKSVRALDLVARWGGDEFVVVGLGEPVDLDRLARTIEQHLNGAIQPQGLPAVSVSLGCAVSGPDAGDLDTLVNRADADMYARRHERRARLRLVRDHHPDAMVG